MGIQVAGALSATTNGTQISAALDGTRGAWVEFIASTSETSNLLMVSMQGNAQKYEGSVCLAIGASGSEVQQFKIPFWPGGTAGTTSSFLIPLTIASGSRVSLSYDSVTANNITARAIIHLFSADNLYKGNSIFSTDLAADGGRGIAIDPGSTANTKGAWTEIDASAAGDADWALVHIGPNENASMGLLTRWLVDIGTGGSGAESAIITDLGFGQDTQENGHCYYMIPLTIASGDRISVRAACTNTDATDRLIDVVLLGFGTDPLPEGGGGGGTTGHVSIS